MERNRVRSSLKGVYHLVMGFLLHKRLIETTLMLKSLARSLLCCESASLVSQSWTCGFSVVSLNHTPKSDSTTNQRGFVKIKLFKIFLRGSAQLWSFRLDQRL